jgi:type I restriction enzyme S subunit
MPNPWPLVPLGRVIRQRSQFARIDDLATYKRVRVQLHAQGIILRDAVAGAEIKTKDQQLCRGGEFLVAEIDAKVGGFGIVPDELAGAIVSSHYFLFELDGNAIHRGFLHYFIRTAFFQDQVRAQGSTNYAAIRPNDVLEYRIPLPPLDEQRRIVARIEQLAAKILEARELRSTAQDQARGFISSAHLHASAGRSVRLAQVLVLREVAEPVQPGKAYPQVGVKGFGQGLFARAAVQAHETTYKAFNRLYDGAIVLSQVKGWEGAVAACDSEFAGRYVSPEYRTFECIPDQTIPAYLAALIATPWFWTKLANVTRGVGARRERIHPHMFLELEVPMPSIDRQKALALSFRRLDALKRFQADTAAELDALLPSILDKAFRGEL